MKQKCIWHIMKENLLLPKDSWEPSKIKSRNIWLQFQKMFMLINKMTSEIEIRNLKLMVMLKYENIYIYIFLQIELKKFLWLKKLKIQWRGHILLVTLMERKLSERFTKNELQKANQKVFRIKKVIKKKHDKLYVK